MKEIIFTLFFIGVLVGYHIYYVEPKIRKMDEFSQIFVIDNEKISKKIAKLSVDKKWGQKEIKEAIDVIKQKITSYNNKGIILDSSIVINPENFDITNKLLEE